MVTTFSEIHSRRYKRDEKNETRRASTYPNPINAMGSTTQEANDWRASTGLKKIFRILKYATALACIIADAFFAAYTKQTLEPHFARAGAAGDVALAQVVFVTLLLAVLCLCAQLALLLRRGCLRCLDRRRDEGEPAADAAAAARCGCGRLLLAALAGLGLLALGTVPAAVAGVRWRSALREGRLPPPDLAARADGLVVVVCMSLGWGVGALLLATAPYVGATRRHAGREREAAERRRVARREYDEWHAQVEREREVERERDRERWVREQERGRDRERA